MRPVGALVPYASNSRTHTPEQIAKIAKSIESFGWTNPILVDGENGILAGHARLKAAQQLGFGSHALAAAKEYRSREVAREFHREHPCPSTGLKTGACPGYRKEPYQGARL
jgi:ParB-like chromosome segregation protein Spo0J